MPTSQPEDLIYHLALEGEWLSAVSSGSAYRRSTLGRSLEDVGFIHCSFAGQVQAIADRVYRGRGDVVLLTVDPGLVPDEIRVENLEGGTEAFPHIYGPLPVASVLAADRLVPGAGGRLLRFTTAMRPRINVITLAVDDLERALAFYRDGLGLPSPGIVGTEFAGDDDNSAGDVVMFQMQGELMLALYPRSELAKDAGVAPPPAAPGSFSIGHPVGSREEVDSVLRAAREAGATLASPAHDRPWGIYSGYFQDPDGHLWEVMWSPPAAGV